MREKKKKNIIIGSLIAIVCMMAIGYSAFLTQLDIKGTTNISSEWSIRIISAEVYNINGDAENVKNTFTDLTANLEANLYNKGDYIDYRIIVENNGDFDAKLDTLGITNSNNEAVKITSSGFTKGQTLYKNTTETLTVRIAYNNDYNGDDPTGTSGESNITLGFVQNEGGTIVPTKDHLVTYDYVTNGGESTTAENEYIAEGASINLSYTASKANYEFLGWSQSPTSTTPLESLTMGTEDIVLYAIFKIIDTTPPTISNVSYTSTSSTITVAVTASDTETEITKYEYSIDGGVTWKDGGTTNTYTFTGLTENTGYDVQVKVTNDAGLTSTSSVSATTKTLAVPTFSGTSNTITITYPEGCGSTLTCSYIKDSGEEVAVTTKTVDVTFTNNGTLAAKVNDGTNYVSSSYTFQVTAAMLVYDNTKTGIDCDNVQCAVDAIKRELG